MKTPQLTSGYWLDAPIAVLRQSPEELAALGQLNFERSEDDLDLVRWARLKSAQGRVYALVRHENSPSAGTEVLVPGRFSDFRTALREVLTSLNLGVHDLAWSHPSVDTSTLLMPPAFLASVSEDQAFLSAVAQATRLRTSKVQEIFDAMRKVYAGQRPSGLAKLKKRSRARRLKRPAPARRRSMG